MTDTIKSKHVSQLDRASLSRCLGLKSPDMNSRSDVWHRCFGSPLQWYFLFSFQSWKQFLQTICLVVFSLKYLIQFYIWDIFDTSVLAILLWRVKVKHTQITRTFKDLLSMNRCILRFCRCICFIRICTVKSLSRRVLWKSIHFKHTHGILEYCIDPNVNKWEYPARIHDALLIKRAHLSGGSADGKKRARSSDWREIDKQQGDFIPTTRAEMGSDNLTKPKTLKRKSQLLPRESRW